MGPADTEPGLVCTSKTVFKVQTGPLPVPACTPAELKNGSASVIFAPLIYINLYIYNLQQHVLLSFLKKTPNQQTALSDGLLDLVSQICDTKMRARKMTRKKDDFEKQLEGYLKDSKFAGAFEEETHKLRLALDRAETKGTGKEAERRKNW